MELLGLGSEQNDEPIYADSFEMFFEHSLDALFSGSPDGRILRANPAACECFQASEKDLIRVGRLGISDPRHPAWQGLVETRRRTGRASGVAPMVRLDGTRLLADVTSAIYLDAKGAERSWVIVRDVTDQLIEADLGGPEQEAAGTGGLAAADQRTLRIIQLTADGLSTKQIAQEIGYSEKYVKNLRGTLLQRYGATNAPHLVAIFLRSGLIR
jgi:PAS domain S-box-containing protein